MVAGAVSDRDGKAQLDHDSGNAGNHHLSGFSWSDEAEVTSEEVPIHRLEDLARANGWPLPTLMKMDVQGHEMLALAGFGGMLDAVPDWILAIEFTPAFWSLEDLMALLRPDGVYQLDEQSLQVVPTSPERLRAIAAGWPRDYYDLILVKGQKALQAIAALPAYSDQLQVRFLSEAGTGFGGLSDHNTRWAGAQASCVIDPLPSGLAHREIEISGQVLRRTWDGVIALNVTDAAGQHQRLLLRPKTPFSLRCQLGSGPVQLRFELRENPGALRRHPLYAFQLSHLEVRAV